MVKCSYYTPRSLACLIAPAYSFTKCISCVGFSVSYDIVNLAIEYVSNLIKAIPRAKATRAQAETVITQHSPTSEEAAAQLTETKRTESLLKRRRDDLVHRGLQCLRDKELDNDVGGGDLVAEVLGVEGGDLDPTDPAGALEVLLSRLQRLADRGAVDETPPEVPDNSSSS